MPVKGGISKPKAAKKKTGRSKVSKESLEKAVESATTAQGESSVEEDTAIYFWRETHPTTGYLSQWYGCPFKDDAGIIYGSAEHYMMYHKALLFKDEAMGAEILAAEHPRQCRSLGRKVSNFDDKTWNDNRVRIVKEGTLLKFTNPINTEPLHQGDSADSPLVETTLRDLLLSTGDRELVEASPFDRIWGVGFGPTKAKLKREKWGLNLLGKILMETRDGFRKEDEAKTKE